MTKLDHPRDLTGFAGCLKTLAATLILLSTMAPAVRAQSEETRLALEQLKSWRPSDEKLIMYRLDWAPSVKTAIERAARENRPVFIIAIHARYGDMFSGHC